MHPTEYDLYYLDLITEAVPAFETSCKLKVKFFPQNATGGTKVWLYSFLTSG
jgi:hypothetical protein